MNTKSYYSCIKERLERNDVRGLYDLSVKDQRVFWGSLTCRKIGIKPLRNFLIEAALYKAPEKSFENMLFRHLQIELKIEEPQRRIFNEN